MFVRHKQQCHSFLNLYSWLEMCMQWRKLQMLWPLMGSCLRVWVWEWEDLQTTIHQQLLCLALQSPILTWMFKPLVSSLEEVAWWVSCNNAFDSIVCTLKFNPLLLKQVPCNFLMEMVDLQDSVLRWAKPDSSYQGMSLTLCLVKSLQS